MEVDVLHWNVETNHLQFAIILKNPYWQVPDNQK